MAYFAPYLDGKGIHLPTYEDRLASLCEAYRSIYGAEAELSAPVQDYQLLSVFAKALDDVSALTLKAFNACNPMYATGTDLDLLLPLYNMTREAGESDASVRARIWRYLREKHPDSCSRILEAVKGTDHVAEARVYINDTDTTDENGIPPHAMAVVARGGYADDIAQAIYDNKPPGTVTWGSTTAEAEDTAGGQVSVSFTRCGEKIVFIYIFIALQEGADRDAIRQAVIPAVCQYVNSLGIAEPLNIPQLYGVVYAANPNQADKFLVTDIQAAGMGDPAMERELVACRWDEKITAHQNVGVSITFS